jgi:NTE family protein
MSMSRAIVLGGGGVTGIAWEIGVLTGLQDGGVDLRADAVFGTSAGAFAGVALTGGDLEERFAAQHKPAPEETAVRLPRAVFAQWIWACLRGWGDTERIGARFGAIARRRTPLTNPDERRRAVLARLATREWPASLRVTAIEALTGKLRVFTQADGCSLVDAVSASGAVPGISPMVRFEDRDWIDGGMVSSANALVAQGFDDILVIAPLPKAYAGVPTVQDDVKRLRDTHARAHLTIPDAASRTAIGPNIYDPTRRPAAADAGRVQGRAAAADLTRWHRQ